ncbi:hypothetical protein A4X09_0g2868 [Tilletia walkeri]|uniref:tRNA (guanine(9)-N1)-methyltransferase n=1 Tax=Tilletia walkeri TaxID=117179 RepID=A0A8X7T5Q6_9BASI|nr:hypothetical protein A4X09_0g2868 [Tilletia walkeri]
MDAQEEKGSLRTEPPTQQGNEGDAPTSPTTTIPLSKRAQKRLAREAKWEERKPLIKAQRKEKDRLAREARKASRLIAAEGDENSHDQPSSGDDDDQERASKKIRIEKENHHHHQVVRRRIFNATLVIDLGFDELMNAKEVKSLAHQLTFVYSANRNASAFFKDLVFVGQGTTTGDNIADHKSETTEPTPADSRIHPPFLESPTGRQLEARTQGSWSRWRGLRIIDSGEGLPGLWAESSQQGIKSMSKKDVIYLTADSENVIHELEEGKAYVLGGIVDKNRYKNLCFEKAQALGIQTAQLPISDALFNPSDDEGGDEVGPSTRTHQQTNAPNSDIKLRSRKVLTVNQVVDILLGWTEQRAEANPGKAGGAQNQNNNGEEAGPSRGSEIAPEESGDNQAPPSQAQLDQWWRAAVRKAFPRRKLKERTARRRPRNEELAALARHQSVETENQNQAEGTSSVVANDDDVGEEGADEMDEDVDEDQLYNNAQLHGP